MQLEGTVLEVLWRNPHALLVVQTEDGVIWESETGPATQLLRSGIERDSISAGDRIRLAGWPPLTPVREIFATNIELPSGDEVVLEPNAELQWSDEGTSIVAYYDETEGDPSRPELGIFRVWSYTPESLFLFPEAVDLNFDMTSYPMTDAARLALQRFDGATDNPTRNCMPKGMPTIMEQPYPMEIVQSGDDILLRIEEYDTLRTIHMDGNTPSAGEPASTLGYSVGRWEGTTLVVTTTHIDWPWFNQLGIPQSQESELLEQFRLSEDSSRLNYELTLTDPVNFTVYLERYWIYLPDVEVLPFECSEAAYQPPTKGESTSFRSGVYLIVLLLLLGGGILAVSARKTRQRQ